MRDHQTDYRKLYTRARARIDSRLASLSDRWKEPRSLYGPIGYVLAGGGKRVRAVLVLVASEAVGGTSRYALPAALAMEILHNFTLVHDDVMDHAGVRRGRPTVHTRWDVNVAILAGDEMIAQAYRVLMRTRSSPERIARILSVYTDALVQVCEGQALDKEFESRRDITLGQYFRMIGEKTGRIITASAEIGAIVGGGSPGEVSALRTYGEKLGIAFQVQDDLLDITGQEEKFGKKIGGDIIEGKKTYLLLKALERATGADRAMLRKVAPGRITERSQIERVREIYHATGTLSAAREVIARSTHLAEQSLEGLPSSRAKGMLLWFSRQLLERSS